jgi:hypothetical protein
VNELVSIPPAGTPVDQRLYNEATAEVERLTKLVESFHAHDETLARKLGAALGCKAYRINAEPMVDALIADRDKLRNQVERLASVLRLFSRWRGIGSEKTEQGRQLRLIVEAAREALEPWPNEAPHGRP